MKALTSFVLLTSLTFTCHHAQATLPDGVAKERLAVEALWQGIQDLPVGERPRIVLVLGGGGVRGLSHIGTLRVFEEERIPIDEIVGVSVGALIGALYAAGISVDKIESMARDIGWDELTDYSRVKAFKLVLTDELFSTKKMESYLQSKFGNKQFQDLTIPFSCVATDLRSGDRVIFREGPVAFAARASATIPGVFKPVKYRHRYLVDGGLVDNLPTDIADLKPFDVVVGVSPTANIRNDEVSSVLTALLRSVEVQKDVISEEKSNKADFLIEPDLGDVAITELWRSQECIEAGTIQTREKAMELKKLIIRRVFDMQNRPEER